MPKFKVPERLKEIAAELCLDLGDERETTNDAEELVAWMRFQLDEQRNEAIQAYDNMEAELNQLEDEMMENTDAEDAT
jgi:hypothetical protein